MAVGPTFVITDDTTAADVAECLAHLNASAKRAPHVLGTEDYPTDWDRWHGRIDVVLDEILTRRDQWLATP